MNRGTGAASRIALLWAALVVLAPAPVATAAQPVATPPKVEFLVPGTVDGSALPLRVSWPAATANGSAIHRYTLEQSVDSGPWTAVTLASRLTRVRTVKLAAWQVITFRVQAEDKAGNVSDWAQSQPVWLSTAHENDPLLMLSPGWTLVADPKSFGGGRASSMDGGATATHKFVGREVAWIAMRGAQRGEADIYLDGALVKTIDLFKSTTGRRRVVFSARWPTDGEHTLAIVNRATPGRPTIDLDAIAVISAPTTQTMVGTGDIAVCGEDRLADEATAAVAAGVEGIVFTLGDNVYPQGDAEHYANCYEPGWGAIKDRTRPVPGNHDYQGNPGGAPYFAYFGANAGDPALGYYRFQAGTWRIYALNSECAQVGGCVAGSAQYEWLAADLAAEPHRCVAALWHRPRFSTGPHGDRPGMADMYRLLHQHGAEMILSGHDHSYQRFAPSDADGVADPLTGTRQFVVGTGGVGLYAFKFESALIEVRDSASHGVLRLDLAPGSYSWEFLPVPGATFTDSGTEACH